MQFYHQRNHLWCKERDIWLSACFIAGKDNVKADALSREFNSNLEWSLNDHIFAYLCTVYGQPDIVLFASRLNKSYLDIILYFQTLMQ